MVDHELSIRASARSSRSFLSFQPLVMLQELRPFLVICFCIFHLEFKDDILGSYCSTVIVSSALSISLSSDQFHLGICCILSATTGFAFICSYPSTFLEHFPVCHGLSSYCSAISLFISSKPNVMAFHVFGRSFSMEKILSVSLVSVHAITIIRILKFIHIFTCLGGVLFSS